MTIKEGYNSKPLHIRISGRKFGGAEVWLEQEGLPEEPSFIKYKETLSYATTEELIELIKEAQEAIKRIAGISNEY